MERLRDRSDLVATVAVKLDVILVCETEHVLQFLICYETRKLQDVPEYPEIRDAALAAGGKIRGRFRDLPEYQRPTVEWSGTRPGGAWKPGTYYEIWGLFFPESSE